jgi:hypothetical protein
MCFRGLRPGALRVRLHPRPRLCAASQFLFHTLLKQSEHGRFLG